LPDFAGRLIEVARRLNGEIKAAMELYQRGQHFQVLPDRLQLVIAHLVGFSNGGRLCR